MHSSLRLLVLCLFPVAALAKTAYYEWTVSWITAAPDGYERPVIGINGEWPCPEVHVSLGDRVVVKVYNELQNQSTSIHWHGLNQQGSPQMDGSSGITQCPIAPGSSMTYDFVVQQTGAYWYHSHSQGQYPDGLWGPFIVHDPNPPFDFDEEIIVTVSEWYHEQMSDLISVYQSPAGAAPDGSPAPPSGGALMNSGKDAKIHVKPSTTYLMHVICPGNYVGHTFYFDGHPMTIVAIDGVYVEPIYLSGTSNLSRVAPGQRMSMLFTTLDTTEKNYGIVDLMDLNMLFINKGQTPPPGYDGNVTGWLVYDDEAPLPPQPVLYSLGITNFYDDSRYQPATLEPPLEPVNHQIVIETNGVTVSQISRFSLNNKTYLEQHVPSLYSAITVNSTYNSNPAIYGQVNPFVVKKDDIVEIVLNNVNTNLHPWHMHGHHFQVIERTAPGAGLWPGTYYSVTNKNPYPVRRDTVMLQNKGWAVIRFRADNPGVWSMHCHVEFHVVSGFVGTLIESPNELSEIAVPKDHLDVCAEYPMPYKGNAAGNEKDPLDLSGSVTEVSQSNHGSNYKRRSIRRGRRPAYEEVIETFG